MDDPTSIGACEECGQTEYLVSWHARKLCHECAIRVTVPLVEPEPLREEPREDTVSISEPKQQSLWMAFAILLVAAGAALAHQVQGSEVALLRQSVTQLEGRLASIEGKLDRVLEGQRSQGERR